MEEWLIPDVAVRRMLYCTVQPWSLDKKCVKVQNLLLPVLRPFFKQILMLQKRFTKQHFIVLGSWHMIRNEQRPSREWNQYFGFESIETVFAAIIVPALHECGNQSVYFLKTFLLETNVCCSIGTLDIIEQVINGHLYFFIILEKVLIEHKGHDFKALPSSFLNFRRFLWSIKEWYCQLPLCLRQHKAIKRWSAKISSERFIRPIQNLATISFDETFQKFQSCLGSKFFILLSVIILFERNLSTTLWSELTSLFS